MHSTFTDNLICFTDRLIDSLFLFLRMKICFSHTFSGIEKATDNPASEILSCFTDSNRLFDLSNTF